jgi:predicted transcriptional regulator
MSKTVSFVARDELAEWLEQRAEERMKSISAVCQDIVAAEYRRQQQENGDKTDQTQLDTGESEESETCDLPSETVFNFESKREADAVRTQFGKHLSENDDARLKEVYFAEGTPGEVVEELERRAKSEV